MEDSKILEKVPGEPDDAVKKDMIKFKKYSE